jgi:ABC-type nickel/cobalt efflux system permease component RcnA
MLAVTSASTGLQIGLMVTALGLGFRHGIDWDHIAAITDLTGSQESGRRSMVLATFYALGHAAVVFVLGVVAIALSAEVPDWIDDTMGRVVGVTLLALGVYVVVSLVRDGRNFRMRSRWMLVFGFVRRLAARRRSTSGSAAVVVTHEHDHRHDDLHDHDHVHAHPHDVTVPTHAAVVTTTAHRHVHHHVGTLPADPFFTYGRPTALAVGALHGIGAETPTQILVFLAAARAGGTAIGIALLVCFIIGLLASNTVVAFTATFGFLRASRNFALYAAVSVVTAAFSLVVGVLLLTGHAPLLPALTG